MFSICNYLFLNKVLKNLCLFIDKSPMGVYIENGDNMNDVQLSYVEDDEKKAIANRISRIIGQLKGIQKMIDDDRTCQEILIQLSSVQNGTKNLSNYILESYLYDSIFDDIDSGNLKHIDEIVSLFRKFNR